MKFKCEREKFMKGLQKAQSITTVKSTLPILANVLIEAEKDGIRLSATDLEVGMKCTVPTEVKKTGAITLPARKLYEIIRELPQESVEIDVDSENRCTIKSGKSMFKIMGMPKEEFPVLPEFKNENVFTIDRDTLSEMIKKTIFSVSQDETRYVLCGVFLDISNGKIKMISTDGRRLSYISKDAPNNKDRDIKVVIPSKAINELLKILNSSEDKEVKIDIGENQVVFGTDNTYLISRLIEGKYPNYEQVIPNKNEIQLKLKRDELLNVTHRVAIMINEKSNSIRYNIKNNKMIVSAVSQGFGEAVEDLDIDYEGVDLKVAYNPVFVMDILKNIECDEVYFELTDSLKPGVIKPADDEEYISVVMPMRI